MTLLEWGALGEIVGGIAIIVSLIYVGMQLKQSNSMARSETRQEISSSMSNWALTLASSPSLAEAMSKVHYHELVRDDASDQEKIQIAYALFALVGQQNFIFQQWKAGLLTDEELDDLYSPGTALHSKPYLKSLWPTMRPSFPTDFAEWYEKRFQLCDPG
jgi:hypothetical protein